MKKEESTREVIISGIVSAAKWDEHAKVTGIKISATDEEEYLVDLDTMGRQLFEHIRNLIKATVIVKGTSGREKLITVKRYEVINRLYSTDLH